MRRPVWDRSPRLVEDYRGRYWAVGFRRGDPVGPRGTYSAWCSDQECIDMVVIVWGVDGWRWHHGMVRSEAFEVWQDAADSAVLTAGARPRL